MKSKCRFHKDGSSPAKGWIFVFGSNLSGLHYGGAAKHAHTKLGAKMYVGEGITGSCYALPTVSRKIGKPLTLNEIQARVEKFCGFVLENSNLNFFVTRVACVLAGYKDEDIAPMFNAIKNCENVSFAEEWQEFLG
jgi:hypothetical protein